VALLQARLSEERFALELYGCNFEQYLYRMGQICRPREKDRISAELFPCETLCLLEVERDGERRRRLLTRLIELYVVKYYVESRPAYRALIEERATLFLNMKHTAEKEVVDTPHCTVRYEQSLCVTLLHLYFVNEFLALCDGVEALTFLQSLRDALTVECHREMRFRLEETPEIARPPPPARNARHPLFDCAHQTQYAALVYRLFFEQRLLALHKACKKRDCVLPAHERNHLYCHVCDYFEFGDAELHSLCCTSRLYNYNRMDATGERLALYLAGVQIEVLDGATLAIYKVLYLTLLHFPDLFRMISLLRLLRSVPQRYATSDMEEEILRIMADCEREAGVALTLEEHGVLLELALDMALLEMVRTAVREQTSEIEKYERSLQRARGRSVLEVSAMPEEVMAQLEALCRSYAALMRQRMRRRRAIKNDLL